MIPLRNVLQFAEDTTAVEALTVLSSPTANRGLVIKNGDLAGLLSITDLARALEVRRGSQREAAARGEVAQARRL
jgi:CBS domain-containing protein